MLRTVGEIALANRLFGGAHAAVAALRRFFPALPAAATLLDVGTGAGDVARAAQRAAARSGVSLRTVGLDSQLVLARSARGHLSHVVCGDALALPFAPRSMDLVLCSQTLHHFPAGCAMLLLRELTRVARVGVVVSDLRRSWIAAAGFWAVSFPLRMHAVTRQGGVVSVLRGFTASELREVVGVATGIRPRVERHAGFRVTASWAGPMPRNAESCRG